MCWNYKRWFKHFENNTCFLCARKPLAVKIWNGVKLSLYIFIFSSLFRQQAAARIFVIRILLYGHNTLNWTVRHQWDLEGIIMSKRQRDVHDGAGKKIAKIRFKKLIRSVILNMQWLSELPEEGGISLNVKKNVAMLRQKRKVGMMTMAVSPTNLFFHIKASSRVYSFLCLLNCRRNRCCALHMLSVPSMRGKSSAPLWQIWLAFQNFRQWVARWSFVHMYNITYPTCYPF